MMTKTEILEAYDRGVGLSAGPVRNVRHEANGRACAIGALENGIANETFLCGDDVDLRTIRLIGLIESLPSKLPRDLSAIIEAAAGPVFSDEGNVYVGDDLGATLASVFNRSLSFAEARAFLDKELTRLVDEGRVQP